MSPDIISLLTLAIFVVAVMYATVGHGGASGYLALMALFGLPPEALKPTALLLNLVVAGAGSYLYLKARQFSWALFWPFAVTSIPASFLGGYFNLPPEMYRPVLGLILFFAAWRLCVRKENRASFTRTLSRYVALSLGLVIGFVSGLIGIGGGIFLSPLMILLGWARVREVSGIAALFILCNSAAGLLGHLSGMQFVPNYAPLLAAAALLGGTLGALCGSRYIPVRSILRVMSLVLVLAGGKMFLA